MGRKPNQVILSYFNRGPKLDDSSNRYQHTCKACGEHFPKGRIEGLINHLTKKCPSISPLQKQEIILQFYDLSETGNVVSPSAKSGNRVEKSKPISLPFSPTKQNFNSLNILAEASRRVGATDPQKNDHFDSLGSHIPLDPSLDIDSFTQTYLNDDENLTSPVNGINPPASIPEAMTVEAPELSSIAASASEILPMTLDMSHEATDIFTNAVHENESREQQDRHQDAQGHAEASTLQIPLETPAEPLSIAPGPALRPLAMSREAHFVPESGTSTKSPKPKVRGKFSPSRRQEVREMRHVGACLRCRMLKKTCSSGNPCQACGAIETPRIWKNRCLRTKLVNEFNLYFVGLNAATTYRELAQLKQQALTKGSAGDLDLYHLNDAPTGVSLKATRVVTSAQFPEFNSLPSNTETEHVESTQYFIIDSDSEDVSKKVDMHIRAEQNTYLAREENPTLKTTIMTGQSLADQKNDALLANVLQLWTCTLLLVDARIRWKGIVSPETSAISTDYSQEALKSLPSPVSPHSDILINAQIRAAIELRGKALTKVILGDLERRLLQKQHDRQFETFLAVLLLLNCFERICWLFEAVQDEQPTKWPFSQSSREFVLQGERFAELIDVLVEMRALPPRTVFDAVKNTLVPFGNQDDVIRQWFETLSITPEYLQFASERPFDKADFHSMDGRFFARLLRPDSERQAKEDPQPQTS